MKVKVAQSCLTLQPPGLYSPWNSPGQNTGVGSLSLLQEIFPTQGSNPGRPHCRRILYQLGHKGSPRCAVGDYREEGKGSERKAIGSLEFVEHLDTLGELPCFRS